MTELLGRNTSRNPASWQSWKQNRPVWGGGLLSHPQALGGADVPSGPNWSPFAFPNSNPYPSNKVPLAQNPLRTQFP